MNQDLFNTPDGQSQLDAALDQLFEALAAVYSNEELLDGIARLSKRKTPAKAPTLEENMLKRRFDQAWDMWPAAGKRRSSKTKALHYWIKYGSKIGDAEMLDAINRYVLSPDAEKDGGAFVPGLDRWLKNQRYEGWLEATAPKRVGFV